jgi:prepilin-type N-terminal cleavage/methylation domain-containing protein
MVDHRDARSGVRDGGFTLVESLVAMMIMVMVFVAFSSAMTTALRGSRINHAAQSATAIGVEHLESARSASWEQLAMTHVEPEAPLIDFTQGVLLAAEAHLEADEALVVSDVGIIGPVTEVSADLTTYTVWRYVTDGGDGLRRIVVYITWDFGDAGFTHRTSTLVSEVATR